MNIRNEAGMSLGLCGELIVGEEFVLIKGSNSWTMLPIADIGMVELEDVEPDDEVELTDEEELSTLDKFELFYQELKRRKHEPGSISE